ncbi:uncharacterized protein LOC119339095 [Triticum dicoccoides]|uniref:uncharacterized protein LOC119339095 n=1 Tax=Triticum dicoccoides TaxID=85692 RepID=UPI0018911577|nr:uncharacterized protein LOC119339095 [Triticum dicoccoides]
MSVIGLNPFDHPVDFNELQLPDFVSFFTYISKELSRLRMMQHLGASGRCSQLKKQSTPRAISHCVPYPLRLFSLLQPHTHPRDRAPVHGAAFPFSLPSSLQSSKLSSATCGAAAYGLQVAGAARGGRLGLWRRRGSGGRRLLEGAAWICRRGFRSALSSEPRVFDAESLAIQRVLVSVGGHSMTNEKNRGNQFSEAAHPAKHTKEPILSLLEKKKARPNLSRRPSLPAYVRRADGGPDLRRHGPPKREAGVGAVQAVHGDGDARAGRAQSG